MKDDFSLKGEVISALETIEDASKGKNLVDAHMIESVDVSAGVVDLVLIIEKGRAREERFALEDSIYDAIEAIGGVVEVKVKMMSPQAIEREANGGQTPGPASTEGAEEAPSAAASRPAPAASAAQPSMPASAPIEGVGAVIAVASGKGGVGKSTVAVNLALALAKQEHRVGLLDVDIYGPSLPTLLGINERPNVANRRILPLQTKGLRIMSLGFLMEEDTPVIWRGPIVTGIIRQFLRDVDWSGLDYLVVDMPPGTGDAQLALAQTVPVDGAIVVTTPSELALVDAARGLEMFKTLNIEVLGMVENMSHFVAPDTGKTYYIFGNEGIVEAEAKRLGTTLLGSIPIDPKVREGGDRGEPVVLSDPESVVAKSFMELAEKISSMKVASPAPGEEEEPKKGLFSFLKK